MWLIHCTEKFGGEEDFATYMTYYYPLMAELKQIIATNKNLAPIRVEAYKSMIDMLWRCFKVFCRKPNIHNTYEPIIEVVKSEVPECSDSTLDHISMAL